MTVSHETNVLRYCKALPALEDGRQHGLHCRGNRFPCIGGNTKLLPLWVDAFRGRYRRRPVLQRYFRCRGCNRNPETRQKLCGAVRWYRAAVVQQLWRRKLIPETRVRSPVATHLLTSLNLPVSSLAPDSNWIPVTLVAEDGLEARAGCRALGRRIV